MKSAALPRMQTVKNESHVLKSTVICEISTYNRLPNFTTPKHVSLPILSSPPPRFSI
jgi:hypothetical protein